MITENKHNIFTLDRNFNVIYVENALVEYIGTSNDYSKFAYYKLADNNGNLCRLDSNTLRFGWDIVPTILDKSEFYIKAHIIDNVPYHVYSLYREPMQLLSLLLKECYLKHYLYAFCYLDKISFNIFNIDFLHPQSNRLINKIYVKNNSSFYVTIKLKYVNAIRQHPKHPSLVKFPNEDKRLTRIVTRLYQMRFNPPKKYAIKPHQRKWGDTLAPQ